MKREREDAALERRVREALGRGLERLDADAAIRLRAARMRALERVPSRRPRRVFPTPGWAARLAPAATAVLALAVTLGFLLQGAGREPPMPSALELLADGADLELVEELEFYEWLGRLDDAG